MDHSRYLECLAADHGDLRTGGHLASDGGQDTINVLAAQAAWTVRPSRPRS